MIVSGLAFGGVIVIMFLCGVVVLAVPVVVMASLFRSPLFGRVIFRGVIGDAVAVVVVRDAGFRRGAVHHLADLQHGLSPVRLFLQHEGGAVLGDDGGVESGLAAAADAQQGDSGEGEQRENATNHGNLGNLGGVRANHPHSMAGAIARATQHATARFESALSDFWPDPPRSLNAPRNPR